jgi:hypothetical protein
MISKNRRLFFSWLSTVTAASSLAFIVFVPSLNTEHEAVRWISITSFLISIVFSATTVMLHKEFDYADGSITEEVKTYHHNILFIALLSYVIAFGALTYTIKPFLFFVFVGALIPCYWTFRKIQNKLGLLK